jgi:hypothetical protein
MATTDISFEIMEYMVWVVEITARKFFNNDKGAAYRALHECGIWDLYVEHYDVTHTLGAEVILDEIKNSITSKGKVTS